MNATEDALIADARSGWRAKRLMKRNKKPAQYDREFSREKWTGAGSNMVSIRVSVHISCGR